MIWVSRRSNFSKFPTILTNGNSYFHETWTGLLRGSWTGTLLEPDDWMTPENGRDDSLPLNNKRSKVIVAGDIVRELLLRFNENTQYSARDKVPPDIIHWSKRNTTTPQSTNILTRKRNDASLWFLIRWSESLLAMEAESQEFKGIRGSWSMGSYPPCSRKKYQICNPINILSSS